MRLSVEAFPVSIKLVSFSGGTGALMGQRLLLVITGVDNVYDITKPFFPFDKPGRNVYNRRIISSGVKRYGNKARA